MRRCTNTGSRTDSCTDSRTDSRKSAAARVRLRRAGTSEHELVELGEPRAERAGGRQQIEAPQAVEAMNIPVNMLSGVGAQQENLAMERENYAANARNWALNAPWMPLQNYASIVYGGATPSTSTETQAAGAARNPLGQAAGAGLTAASIYQMMQA